jgi:chromosome segregation ATPase
MSEELDTAKERLLYHERENSDKHNQEETYETENLDLLQQKSEFQDKRKDLNGELEDARTKHECLAHDLTNLTMNLERIQYVWLIFSLLFLNIALYYNL